MLTGTTNIPVRLVKEPHNPYDSRAIAFECELEGKWHVIGYVVTDEVHDAMDQSRIVSVKFAWVNYVVDWRSGPGWRNGFVLARRKASTR